MDKEILGYGVVLTCMCGAGIVLFGSMFLNIYSKKEDFEKLLQLQIDQENIKSAKEVTIEVSRTVVHKKPRRRFRFF